MGHMTGGVGNIGVGAVLQQVVITQRGATLFIFTIVYNDSKMRVGGEVCCLWLHYY